MLTQGLPGFRDFYPDEAALRTHIFSAWRHVATKYGFQEYDGPPLEPLELYVKKSGEEIVGQLYTFQDQGGRPVALRPEMTPTLARMVGARGSALKKPIRWFSMPQLFRYERPQRGRLREHFQLNLDIIGEASPLADAEVIAAGIDIMRALGLGPDDVRVRVSDRQVVRAMLHAIGLGDEMAAVTFQHIDKVERENRDELASSLSQAAGVSVEIAQRALSIGEIRGLETVVSTLDQSRGDVASTEPLSECVEALGVMGLGDFVDVDLSIVRGLAYYTGIVFELFDAGKSLRAICGGGRYDGLLGALGGADLPAVGFGMGDVVLGELLVDRGIQPSAAIGIDVFLVAVTGQDQPKVLELGHRLRDRGLKVEYSLKTQPIAKQLKLAAARSAAQAVIIGPDERRTGQAVVRDLASGNERHVPFAELERVL
jgi:histidyl-tRNA synthetase